MYVGQWVQSQKTCISGASLHLIALRPLASRGGSFLTHPALDRPLPAAPGLLQEPLSPSLPLCHLSGILLSRGHVLVIFTQKDPRGPQGLGERPGPSWKLDGRLSVWSHPALSLPWGTLPPAYPSRRPWRAPREMGHVVVALTGWGRQPRRCPDAGQTSLMWEASPAPASIWWPSLLRLQTLAHVAFRGCWLSLFWSITCQHELLPLLLCCHVLTALPPPPPCTGHACAPVCFPLGLTAGLGTSRGRACVSSGSRSPPPSRACSGMRAHAKVRTASPAAGVPCPIPVPAGAPSWSIPCADPQGGPALPRTPRTTAENRPRGEWSSSDMSARASLEQRSPTSLTSGTTRGPRPPPASRWRPLVWCRLVCDWADG